MKVAMITRDYPPRVGGIVTHTSKLVEHLTKLGAEVRVLEGKSDWGTLMIPRREDLAAFDIVHVQSAPYAAFAKKHPLIVTAHSPVLEERKYYTGQNRLKSSLAVWLEKRALRKADRVIAVSKLTRDQLQTDYDVDPSMINLIPEGVDCEEFKPGRKEGAKVKILMCSRLDRRKNIAEGLTSITGLRGASFEATIVGDGGERVHLERLAQKLGLRVEFTGAVRQDNLPKYFAESNIFLSTSHSEGFGLSLLQAMASGCAVLVSDIPVHRELIENQLDGLVYTNTKELQNFLRQLADDQAWAAKLGEQARKKALRYSWDNVARATKTVYEQALIR